MQGAQGNSEMIAINIISPLLLVTIKQFNKNNLLSNILIKNENFS